jgi:RNase H-fold protein (predicted Holliday junction resolvase)
MTTILGVSFSSRMIGLAVLQSHDLIDYSVKLFKETWTPVKMNRMLTSLSFAIDNYNITNMVLSIPPVTYRGEPFHELWQEIIMLGKQKKIAVTMYKHSELQVLCGSEERMTRKLLMETLTAIYPDLVTFYKRERRNKNKYYHKMFEAIASATLFVQKREV